MLAFPSSSSSFFLALLLLLATSLLSSAAVVSTRTVTAPALAKRQSCTNQYFCPQASSGGALLRIPLAVRANVLVAGQTVQVLVCDYTTVLSSSALVNSQTCVYLGTNGLLTTASNIQLNINSATTCPTQATCTPPEAVASTSPASAVRACAVAACPRSTFRGTLSRLQAEVPVGVGAVANVAGLAGVNLLVCTYTSVSTLTGLQVGSSACVYNAQISVGRLPISLTSITNLVGNIVGGLTGLLGLGGAGAGFTCPAVTVDQTTCPTITPLLSLRRSVRSSKDWAREAVRSRQWNPKADSQKKQKASGLKRRKW